MVKHLIVGLLVCLASFSAQAQRYVFPDEPGAFLGYVEENLKKTNQPKAMATAESFRSLWEGSGLNNSQKASVIRICQKMALLKATIATEYADFFQALCNASLERKLGSGALDGYLSVSEKLVETKAAPNIKLFFERSRTFLLNNALHGDKFSRCYAPGDFVFEYVEDSEAVMANFTSTSDATATEKFPKIAGPVLRFSKTDVLFATPFDSTGIRNTQGYFLILSNQWVGKGGSFDWQSVELDPNAVHCDFDVYHLEVNKPVILAQNVKMHYTLLLSQTLTGEFEFASKARKTIGDAKYPRFTSYRNDIFISEFGQDLSFQGGFSLEGRQISSMSKVPGGLSVISGLKNGETAFNVRSGRFNISDSLVTAQSARLSIYFGPSDSLYHASLQFKLFKKDRVIQLVRDRNSASASMPFINNYHKFYIHADVVKYDLERDSLDIFMLGVRNRPGEIDTLHPATFESFDFFDVDRFNEMTALYDFHPIKLLDQYAQTKGSTTFYVQDVAADFRHNEGILRGVANDLQNRGYLDFDSETGLITLGRRLLQTDSSDLFRRAVERVNAKKARPTDESIYANYDHDNFFIRSSVPGGVPNASLVRENNELVIRGIYEPFPISLELGVFIEPDSSLQRVTVYGGRNLYMEKGEVTVGNFRFLGRNFFMLYDDFNLIIPEIDKILFAIRDTTESKEGQWYEYGQEISFGAGEMQINERLNKSGLKKGKIAGTEDYYESFPKLSIPQGGKMYFATDYRQNFSYDSTRAYFEIAEISMDSLNTKVPIFPGRFISTIFPEFEEQLIPMPPLRLPEYPETILAMGFVHQPPKSGYDMYPKNPKLKGAHINFTRELIMNGEGLLSGGKINYLTTILDAPEYIFMPDSVVSGNIEFQVKPGKIGTAEFAEAKGINAQLHWQTTEDLMNISNRQEIIRLEDAKSTLAEGVFEARFKEKLFTLYEGTDPATLNGNLYLSREGLRGEGNLTRRDFSILSVSEEPFEFSIARFAGSNVEFRINSKDRDPYEYDKGYFYNNNKAVFIGNFVDFDFDLKNGQCVIRPDQEFGDFTALSLPYSEYRTSIKEALWDLKKRNITMRGDSTSIFTSTIFGNEDYNAENLVFNASSAFYDIPNLSLLVEGVPFINSADASIVPEDGKVVILKDAEMQELKKAIVLIDTLNRYHRLFDGNIRIKSRFEFEGDATYQFVNVQKDTFNVKFDKFELIEPEEVSKAERRKGTVPKFTFAQGTVTEEDNFFITSRVLYKGQIKMYANQEELSLDGYIKLALSNSSTELNEWIPYKSDRGDEVSLALEEKREVDGQIITSGLHFVSGANELYTTFMSPKRSADDVDVFLASGVLDYAPAINEFKISPQGRRDGTSFTGNRLIYDDSKGSVFVEGLFNLVDAGLANFLKISGSGRIDITNKKYAFDSFLTFDLPIDFKGLSMMQAALTEKIPVKTITLDKNDPLVNKIAEIAGNKEVQKFAPSFGLQPTPVPEISKELKKSLVFSKVNLEWSEEYKTFYSVGGLRLLSIYDKIFDEEVTGFIEVRKSADGDGFSIYLQIDPDVWYYFEMEAGTLSVLGSDEAFNDALGSKTSLAGIDKKEAFIAKFRAIYGAPELPKKPEEPQEEEETPKEEEEDDGF